MNREKIIIPRGIRYISEWNEFRFNKFPNKCIINKQLPGCGFTEYCINGPENVILCSPRKMLLENKKDQHPDDVYLVVNEMEKESEVDKDLSKEPKSVNIDEEGDEKKDNSEIYERLYREIDTYTYQRYLNNQPAKILVTYDSYRIVKDILEKLRIFDRFITVVDEFQSILHDSRFKSNTELGFLLHLQQSPTAYFVSATPMMEKYLEMLDEFKDLPYFDLDWEAADSSRIIRPSLKVLTMKSVGTKAEEVIQSYLSGDFEEITVMRNGQPVKVISDEAVFYVNSVNHIISMIKKNNLTPEQCNILCSRTDDNAKRIKRKLGKKFVIGKVPKKTEKPKMFTFCTRTVYLGADFYSLCARSFIFSDSNSDCLAVDIAEDLPQILGRQRLQDNPWKNTANFYYRITADYREMKESDFQAILDRKTKDTESLLRAYGEVSLDEDKYTLAKNYQILAKSQNYKDNYVAVNKVINSQTGNVILKPVTNKLVLVNEIRAFQIQQVDYRDRFSVFSSIRSNLTKDDIINRDVTRFLCIYDTLTTMLEKFKMLCEYPVSKEVIQIVLDQIADSDEIKSYYLLLGPDRLKKLHYNITNIRRELGIVTFSPELLNNTIHQNFNPGEKYTLANLKAKLRDLYSSISYTAVPKANDILEYFEVKEVQNTMLVDGVKKRIRSYELLKRKDN
nr:MAG: U3 small nucleolar RNA-associated SSU processome protein 25 [Bacteriophage sp.]